MNLIDVIALLFLVLGTFVGYRRGLSGELSRLVSVIFALLVGLQVYRPLGAWVVEHTRLEARSAETCAYAVTIVAAILGMVLVRVLFKFLMKLVFEETTDKVGGAVAGFLRACATVLIVFVLMNLWPHDYLNRHFGEESLIGRIVLKHLPSVREKMEALPLPEPLSRLSGKRGG